MKENQKSQLIILCVLVAIVVCYGGYKLIGTQTRADSEIEQEAPITMQADMVKSTDDSSQVLIVDYGVERSIRDPFAQQMVAETPSSTPPPAARTVAAQDITMPFPLMPSFIGPFNDDDGAVLVSEDHDPLAGFRLTGVIEGDVNLAIIRGPDDERYIVREGQRVGGKFYVESITREGVHLIFDDESFVLGLGVRELS